MFWWFRISKVVVFATTLECDGDSVERMSCVGVPGSSLDGVVCLSVNIMSIVVRILERSCVRIIYKYIMYRYKYIYIQDPNQRFYIKFIFGWYTVITIS